MERRKFFQLGMAATAVAAMETLQPSQAQATFWWGCLSQPKLTWTPTPPSLPGDPFVPPKLNIKFTAGRSGAPGGFVLEFMKKADYVKNCNRWYSAWDCRLSVAIFDVNRCGSLYDLDSCESINVSLGDLANLPDVWTNTPVLDADTAYVIRGYAQSYGCWCYKSSYSSTIHGQTNQIGLPPS